MQDYEIGFGDVSYVFGPQGNKPTTIVPMKDTDLKNRGRTTDFSKSSSSSLASMRDATDYGATAEERVPFVRANSNR